MRKKIILWSRIIIFSFFMFLMLLRPLRFTWQPFVRSQPPGWESMHYNNFAATVWIGPFLFCDMHEAKWEEMVFWVCLKNFTGLQSCTEPRTLFTFRMTWNTNCESVLDVTNALMAESLQPGSKILIWFWYDMFSKHSWPCVVFDSVY